MDNKKGQGGTPIWIIIALVLGILVLVVLALGFTQGWGNLWAKLTGWGGTDTLSEVTQDCQIANSKQDAAALEKTRTIKGMSDTQIKQLGFSPDQLTTAMEGEAQNKDVLGQLVVIEKKGDSLVVRGPSCTILEQNGLINY